MMKLRIGTRKSRLAMVQTELVKAEILKHFPSAEIELVPITTRGDRQLDRSLASFGGKGVFTRDRRPKLAAHFLRKRWADIPNFGYKNPAAAAD